jgi:site-specific DNA-methyltransferase (adenine-specific)
MPELTLHNGDCLEVMKAIPDKSVDLIICDLPYGCLSSPRASKGPGWRKVEEETGEKAPVERISKDKCAWDIKINLEEFWKQVKRIRKSDHSPTIHFATTKFGYEIIKSNEAEFRYDLVWDKQRGVSFLSANKMPMRSHEMIYIFSKAGAYYERKDFAGTPYTTSGNSPGQCYKQHNTGKSETKTVDTRCVLSVVKPPAYMEFKEHKQYGKAKSDSTYGVVNRKKPVTRPVGTVTSTADKRCVLSVVEHPSGGKRTGHPTEKPCALYRFLIERYCPADGTVLDPTFGSGNSVFTAFALGRNAIGIEKDEKFFKKAEERLNALP